MLDSVADLVILRRRYILGLALLLTLVSGLLASGLRFDPDMLNFLPADTPEVATFREVLDALGTLDQHVVAVKLPPGTDPAQYAPLVDRLAGDLAALDSIARVDYRLPDTGETILRLLPKAMLLLTPDEVDEVARRLTDEAIAESVAKDRALLQTPQSMIVKDLVLRDPLRLHTILLRRLAHAGGGFRIDTSSGYILSADRSTYVIFARPVRPAHDLPFAASLMSDSRALARRELASFQAAHPGTKLPEIAFAGGYAINTADARLVRADMVSNMLTSFGAVLLLVVLAFRRRSAVLYAALPMALAIVTTFAFAAVTVGTLSAASAGFAALLAGLGIDFITVFYGRYAEERSAGALVPTALRTTIHTTLPGIALAAVTTAATFYAFLFTDFRGMTHMGLLTGTGILFFLAAVALVLPALIGLMDERVVPRPRERGLVGFGSGALVCFAVARPKTTIAIWGAVIVICTAASFGLKFNDDPANIRARGNAGVDTQEHLARKFGRSFDFVLLVADGATADQALSRGESLLPRLDGLVRRRVIGAYESLSTIVPSPQHQRDVMAKLAAGRKSGAFNIDRIAASLDRAAERNGFRAGVWDDSVRVLGQALHPSEPLDVERIDEPALTMLRERFLQRIHGRWVALTYVYPPGERWGQSVAPQLTALGEGSSHVTLTGVNVVAGALRSIARADAARATAIGVVAVFLLFAIVFRSPRRAAFMFIPFIAGCLSMTGLMSITGMTFNPINIFVGLMLIGIGTDYAIYMDQRRREAPDAFTDGAAQTAKAVTMAALTSIVGYGSFALSHYPGLRSIGYASMFGIAASGLAAITLIPALLAMGTKNNVNLGNGERAK